MFCTFSYINPHHLAIAMAMMLMCFRSPSSMGWTNLVGRHSNSPASIVYIYTIEEYMNKILDWATTPQQRDNNRALELRIAGTLILYRAWFLCQSFEPFQAPHIKNINTETSKTNKTINRNKKQCQASKLKSPNSTSNFSRRARLERRQILILHQKATQWKRLTIKKSKA